MSHELSNADRAVTALDEYAPAEPSKPKQQAEPGAGERGREALAAFSALYSACTTALFAMGCAAAPTQQQEG
ncbi:hypothetical protein 3Fb_00025 [Ralstonia phage Eline]|uniref:Uncharacterized protein n=1 Tax=Ralstonia phage Eline TaxID=2759724 RepID=A0A7G5B9Q5_9CAUD|nr:hypothetical protein KMC45_gp25 [Ralstonia phage Eline]QMV33028.1 hypothetical protein 3Fb_00025 [Ralstonia phage Eline]